MGVGSGSDGGAVGEIIGCDGGGVFSLVDASASSSARLIPGGGDVGDWTDGEVTGLSLLDERSFSNNGLRCPSLLADSRLLTDLLTEGNSEGEIALFGVS